VLDDLGRFRDVGPSDHEDDALAAVANELARVVELLCVKTTSWAACRHRALGRPGELLPDEPVAKSARPNPGAGAEVQFHDRALEPDGALTQSEEENRKLFRRSPVKVTTTRAFAASSIVARGRAWMRAALRPSPY